MNFHSFSLFPDDWGNLTQHCCRWIEPMFCIHLKHTKLKHKMLWNPSDLAANFFLIFFNFSLISPAVIAENYSWEYGVEWSCSISQILIEPLHFSCLWRLPDSLQLCAIVVHNSVDQLPWAFFKDLFTTCVGVSFSTISLGIAVFCVLCFGALPSLYAHRSCLSLSLHIEMSLWLYQCSLLGLPCSSRN